MSEFSDDHDTHEVIGTHDVIGFDPPGADEPTATLGSEAPGSEAPGSEAPGSEAPGSEAPGSETPRSSPRWAGLPGVKGAISILEHAQELVTVIVGAILIVLAAVLLISGIVDFVTTVRPISQAAPLLLDDVLLVLILVEIVHTVVLSLRAHRLMAQPFIVVGLVAVIRRILFVLTPGTQTTVTTSELALLIAMVFVFIAGLIAVSRFERREE